MTKENQIVYGKFYTPPKVVELVYDIVKRNNIQYDIIVDTSCGYGEFIKDGNFIVSDIDPVACEYVRTKHRHLMCCHNVNSLMDTSIKKFIGDRKILIVGNPPYNNNSSFYKKNQKGDPIISEDLKSRDLGISFLKSYDKLEAEYVCVLHPLSYLIKKSNFNHLGRFKDNYHLIDCVVISSFEFNHTSKNTSFPIIIALYKRGIGMKYEEICNYKFNIQDTNKYLCLNNFEYVEKFHTKYKDKNTSEPYSHYSTLRDMNWLSINKGWLANETNNSIRVVNKQIFDNIERMKQWYTKNKKQYYFLGNLSPIYTIATDLDSYFDNNTRKVKNE